MTQTKFKSFKQKHLWFSWMFALRDRQCNMVSYIYKYIYFINSEAQQ